MTVTVDAPATRAPARRKVSLAVPLAIAAAVVVLDQLTKHWAQNALAESTKHIIWTLQLNLSFNSGMAFSTGRGIGPFIGAVAIVVIIGLAMSVRRVAGDSMLAAVAAGLVVGWSGAGLHDRLRGHRRPIPPTFSSTRTVAHGIASNRSRGIGRPDSTE